MKEEIKECILKLYPSGRFEEKNADMLLKGDYLNSIYSFLKRITSIGNINYVQKVSSPKEPAFSFVVTLKGDPGFNEWENFSDEEKIQWLKMANRKYTCLWLFFSRVYPVYEYDFDFWSFKAEIRQLIYESDYETSDNRWNLFLENTRKILEEYKIQRIAFEELLEEVDFVKEEFFEDEGDSESGIKKSIRKYRNTNVYQCLFQ